MEEESQVRKWALGHPLCIAPNARQGAFLTLRGGMCGPFLVYVLPKQAHVWSVS